MSLGALKTVGVESLARAGGEQGRLPPPGFFSVTDNLVLGSLSAPVLGVALTRFTVMDNPALPGVQATAIFESLEQAPASGGLICGNRDDLACEVD